MWLAESFSIKHAILVPLRAVCEIPVQYLTFCSSPALPSAVSACCSQNQAPFLMSMVSESSFSCSAYIPLLPSILLQFQGKKCLHFFPKTLLGVFFISFVQCITPISCQPLIFLPLSVYNTICLPFPYRNPFEPF